MVYLFTEAVKLESSGSEPLSSDAGVVGVVVSGGTDVHAVVGLDVTASSVVSGDTTLGLLGKSPARVVSADAVDGVDEDLGGLLQVSLRVPGALGVVVSSIDLHQTEAVAGAAVAITPAVLAVPGLESGASSGLSGDDTTDDVVIDSLGGTSSSGLGLVLSEVGPIVGGKSLGAGLAAGSAVTVLKQ